MRAVIQRVKKAKVIVEGEVVSAIEHGILTLLGVARGDDEGSVEKLIRKIVDLRIFEDEQGKLNRSIKEVKGMHLIVSQFTLLGDCSKGTRPSFVAAESPEKAKDLYEKALSVSTSSGVPTKGGVFRAHMDVEFINDGPVTLILES